MIRVVLVDDQELVLQGLSGLIPWEEAGFTIVGRFTSAREAFGFIRAERPDVVMTDIRMPEMSGLELIEALNAAGQKPEIVFISSYRDFDAAKEAIRLGVSRYIVKPFEEDEVLATLAELRQRLSRQELPCVDPLEPLSYRANPAFSRLCSQVSLHARCFLLLSEYAFRPAEAPNTCAGALRVHGYVSAWLIAQKKGIPSVPAHAGLSRVHRDFRDFGAFLSEAELSLRGCFAFSEHEQAADIQQYLCERLLDNPSLDELASHFYLSRTRLCALFRSHTGYSPASFLQHVRLHLSRWRLLHTDMRIREVAESVGYWDTSYFGRLYKREFAMTPEECRLRRDLLL